MTSEEKLVYLEGFINDTSVERIKELKEKESENTKLKEEITQLKEEYKKLKSSVDTKVEATKRVEKRIAEADKSEAVKNLKYNIESKKIKPLKREKDKLEQQLKDLSQDHERIMQVLEEQTTALNEQTTILQKILDIVSSGESVQEIQEQVTKTASPTKEKIRQECIQIHSLLAEGKLNKEIAEILYPGDKRGAVRVSERKKSKAWKELYGEHS